MALKSGDPRSEHQPNKPLQPTRAAEPTENGSRRGAARAAERRRWMPAAMTYRAKTDAPGRRRRAVKSPAAYWKSLPTSKVKIAASIFLCGFVTALRYRGWLVQWKLAFCWSNQLLQ